MRFETSAASNYLVRRFQHVERVASIQDEGDVILLTLKTGEKIMIFLVEEPLSLRDLQFHLTENTAKGIYSLFIFQAVLLLPDHNTLYAPDDWMQALLSAQDNTIYAYEGAGRDAFFFPVYFRGKRAKRRIRYGDIVNYAAITCGSVHTFNPYLAGTWLIAGFEAGARHARAQQQEVYADRTPLTIYFEVLSIPETTDLAVVKKAFRELARKYHPDLNNSREALFRMKQINDAYQHILAHLRRGEQ